MPPGRNEPCQCGSGKKFKHCCGSPVAIPAPLTAANTVIDTKVIGTLVAQINQGRLLEAEQAAMDLLRVQPAQGILWKILGVALLRQDKDALRALQRAAQLLPRDPEVHTNLGGELRLRGELEAALASLRRAIELQPRNCDTLIEAADVLRTLGRPREAVAMYQSALGLNPRRAHAHNNLGNAFLDLGDTGAAANSYRRALQLQPDDAQVLFNLANTLRQLGEFDESMRYTRRCLELAPDLSMAHNNLGLLLTARGEHPAAASAYHAALQYNPRNVEALSNLGNSLRRQGQRREALAVLQRALELDTKRADSHCNLGHALLESRQLREAADSFRHALTLQPNLVAAHLGLAAALRVQGLNDEARAHGEAAIALEPSNPDAMVLLGELRADRGDFQQAQALFSRVLSANPRFAPAYYSIAAHRRMTREDAAWLAGAATVLKSPLALADEMQLRYALGKYFDDVGEYEQAFANYQLANELSKRYGGTYDGGRLASLIGQIIERCDAGFMQAARGASNPSDEPVFIVGMPRSGTSLTEQILASHPNVYGAGEVRFWDRVWDEVVKGQLLAEVGSRYLARVRRGADGALRITDKMPANFLYAGLIHAGFPRARIIHMRRDPLDTCVSVYFQNFFNVSPYANDLQHLAHYYEQYLRIMAHWRTVLPQETLLEVPYEGLVQDTEGWTRRMLAFIGLPWDARCLEFQDTERTVITASRWQVRQKISSRSIGRWRNYQQFIGPLSHLAKPL